MSFPSQLLIKYVQIDGSNSIKCNHGFVHTLMNRQSNEEVIVKEIVFSDDKNFYIYNHNIIKELYIYTSLRDTGITPRIYDLFFDGPRVFMVLEKCFPVNDKLNISDACKKYQQFVSYGFIHNDLKYDNVGLIGSEFKIFDFGSSLIYPFNDHGKKNMSHFLKNQFDNDAINKRIDLVGFISIWYHARFNHKLYSYSLYSDLLDMIKKNNKMTEHLKKNFYDDSTSLLIEKDETTKKIIQKVYRLSGGKSTYDFIEKNFIKTPKKIYDLVYIIKYDYCVNNLSPFPIHSNQYAASNFESCVNNIKAFTFIVVNQEKINKNDPVLTYHALEYIYYNIHYTNLSEKIPCFPQHDMIDFINTINNIVSNLHEHFVCMTPIDLLPKILFPKLTYHTMRIYYFLSFVTMYDPDIIFYNDHHMISISIILLILCYQNGRIILNNIEFKNRVSIENFVPITKRTWRNMPDIILERAKTIAYKILICTKKSDFFTLNYDLMRFFDPQFWIII